LGLQQPGGPKATPPAPTPAKAAPLGTGRALLPGRPPAAALAAHPKGTAPQKANPANPKGKAADRQAPQGATAKAKGRPVISGLSVPPLMSELVDMGAVSMLSSEVQGVATATVAPASKNHLHIQKGQVLMVTHRSLDWLYGRVGESHEEAPLGWFPISVFKVTGARKSDAGVPAAGAASSPARLPQEPKAVNLKKKRYTRSALLGLRGTDSVHPAIETLKAAPALTEQKQAPEQGQEQEARPKQPPAQSTWKEGRWNNEGKWEKFDQNGGSASSGAS